MKSYVINLLRADDRRAFMQSQGDRHGLDMVLLPAVDGLSLPESEYKQRCPEPGRTHRLSPTEAACFLSHRLAWQAIADGSDLYGAVLEDDVLISQDGAGLLRSGDWVPKGCDIIKVETIARPIFLESPSIVIGQQRKLWRIASPNTGGGAYILSRVCASALLSRTEVFCDPLDHFLFDPQLGKTNDLASFQMDPAICVQQVRSAQVFMDHHAGKSQMDGLRGTEKRRGISKAVREIVRPFGVFGRRVYFTCRVFLLGGRYGKIPVR